jgi:hypothetical protein
MVRLRGAHETTRPHWPHPSRRHRSRVAVHRRRAALRANAIVAPIRPKAAPVILTTDEERRRLDARAGLI